MAPSTALLSLPTFLAAASSVAGRSATDSASTQTLSMLCASSKTTTHSRSRSRETIWETLGSSMYW